MKYENNNLKNQISDNNFLNVHYSITIAYKYFKCCLLSPHINPEGKLSQIFNLGLSLYFMSKKRETFSTIFKHHF